MVSGESSPPLLPFISEVVVFIFEWSPSWWPLFFISQLVTHQTSPGEPLVPRDRSGPWLWSDRNPWGCAAMAGGVLFEGSTGELNWGWLQKGKMGTKSNQTVDVSFNFKTKIRTMEAYPENLKGSGHFRGLGHFRIWVPNFDLDLLHQWQHVQGVHQQRLTSLTLSHAGWFGRSRKHMAKFLPTNQHGFLLRSEKKWPGSLQFLQQWQRLGELCSITSVQTGLGCGIKKHQKALVWQHNDLPHIGSTEKVHFFCQLFRKGGDQWLEHPPGPAAHSPLLEVRPHRAGLQPLGHGPAARGPADSGGCAGEAANGAERSTGAGRQMWTWQLNQMMLI